MCLLGCYVVFVDIFLYIHLFKWSLIDVLALYIYFCMIYIVLEWPYSAAVIVWLPCLCLGIVVFFFNKKTFKPSKQLWHCCRRRGHDFRRETKPQCARRRSFIAWESGDLWSAALHTTFLITKDGIKSRGHQGGTASWQKRVRCPESVDGITHSHTSIVAASLGNTDISISFSF